MSAMGLGSYLSKYIRKNLFDWLVFIEISVGIIGGTCALILFYTNLYLEIYQLVMYFEIIIIGTLVGAEIPVLTRIIENDNENLRVTLSSIFSFDYLGGLVGSIAFPIFLLPQLGYFTTSFFTGTMNIVAAALIIFKYGKSLRFEKIYKILIITLLFFMGIGMVFSDKISKGVEDGLYRDRVIFSKQSQYQKIVITKHKDDLRLYIDGNVQFCSLDEYRYHEALVHIPMSVAEKRKNILLLGAGDGMAVRELLKYKDNSITLVDLDKEIIEICKNDPNISRLNENSLKSKNLEIINEDAFKYLKETDKKFDVIIVDLPDPNNEGLNKLYTNIFYRLCYNALTEDGVMSIQSTSPYFATNAFWCINKTLESEGFFVKPYHLQVPAFGDWGFNLATKKEITKKIDVEVETKFLTNSNIDSLFIFAKDEFPKEKIEINSLSKPILIDYYSKAVKDWN